MKSLKTFAAIFIIIAVAQAEELKDDYWKLMRQKAVAAENATSNEEAEALALEYLNYINSLSANQLLIAARDCAAEAQSRIPQEHWNEALWALVFFAQNYPVKTHNLENISPLLTDLQNASMPPFWRYSIMQLLGVEWREEPAIKSDQKFAAANMMKQIAADKKEQILLRIKAARMSTGLFRDVHRSNISDDPDFKKEIEKGRENTDVFSDIREGRLIPAQKTIERNRSIETAIAESIEAQIDILAEPNLPAYPGGDLLGSLTDLRNYDETGKIKTAMANALQNYKNYDEYLWRDLVRTNMIYFENDEAESILQRMINDAKRKLEKEDTLPELQRKLDKGEIKRQPYNPGSALIKL